MSAELVGIIGGVVTAIIGGLFSLFRFITPKLQNNAIVIEGALNLVRTQLSVHHRDQLTIERLESRIDMLEAENELLRKGQA